MNDILSGWVASHLSLVATWIVGISAVGLAIKKYGPKVRKFIKIGRRGLDIIDSLMDALADDKITDEEIAKLLAEVQIFKNSLK